MAKIPAKGNQLITLPVDPTDLDQISFNMLKHDQFVRSHGVTFQHFRAMPSPVGLKDRGEYRRSDALDTISSNGMIYKQCGCFTAPLLGNSKKHNSTEDLCRHSWSLTQCRCLVLSCRSCCIFGPNRCGCWLSCQHIVKKCKIKPI